MTMQQGGAVARGFIATVLAGMAAVAAAQQAGYPVKPVRVIVPFAPGGTTDTAWRIVGPRLADALGQQVVIDNRPGAGSTLGAALLGQSPADGHTLLGTANVHALSASVYKVAYHPVNDFAPIAQMAEQCAVLVVHPSLPVRSPREFIALAKSRPGEIDFATTGVGTGQHMFMALLISMTGTRLNHVPYRGVAQSVPDLIAGRVQVKIAGVSILIPHVRNGRLRAVAVSSARRSQFLPEVPTLDEGGVKGYEATLREGVFARSGTPAEVVARLEREIMKIVAAADVQKSLLAAGGEPNYASAAQWGAHVAAEYAKWTRLVKEIGIKVE
jgi:tripartite-type tricarboxylate transporter receptor subunit TctC